MTTPAASTAANPNPAASPDPAATPAATPAPAADPAPSGDPNPAPADPAAGGGNPDPAANPGTGGDGQPTPEPAAVADPNKPADPKPTWPEDWRQQMAAGDDKMLATLNRFNSPAEVYKAYAELRTKISKGEIKAPLKADATPEEIAEYRAANGIPETAEGYDLSNIGDGIVLGDDDKAAIKPYLDSMHAKNVHPDVVREGVKVYMEAREEETLARIEADETAKTTTTELLKQEWGAEYNANINRVLNFVRGNFPAELQDSFLQGRLADGTPIFSSPEALRALSRLERTLNPTGTVVPGGGADNLQSINDEIAAIEKRMSTDRTNYFKDEKAQARYRDLVAARERFSPKK